MLLFACHCIHQMHNKFIFVYYFKLWMNKLDLSVYTYSNTNKSFKPIRIIKKIKIDSNQYHLHNARPCFV